MPGDFSEIFCGIEDFHRASTRLLRKSRLICQDLIRRCFRFSYPANEAEPALGSEGIPLPRYLP
jgi:hypothetical protein